jgi:cysteine desulfurase
MRPIYFDSQTTTPVLPEVFEAMRPFFAEAFGSPSSLHQHGLRARDALQHAREQCAAFLHAESPEDILFTSGATEAANLALKGVAWASQRRGNHIVLSAIEHPAVIHSVEFLEKHGFTATRIRPDDKGWVDPAAVGRALTDQTILLCVHHANHDLGTIQPVREIATLAAERGVPFFVDAVAGAGWTPLDVQDLGANLLSFSPHRFYGPKGVGVLYRGRGVRLQPLLHGGAQEGGRRAGVENVPAIVGAGVAAEIAGRELEQRMNLTSRLQRHFWEGLRRRIPYVKLHGPEPGLQRLSTTLNLSFEFVEGEGVALMADMQGLSVSSGATCVSKALKVSPVLKAIGVDHALAQGNVLVSFGRDNTDEEVKAAIDILDGIVKKLRAMSPMWDDFQQGRVDSVTQPGAGPGRMRANSPP